jgi:uncharacterized SAM-binding protein YcdF (DUF218 family)
LTASTRRASLVLVILCLAAFVFSHQILFALGTLLVNDQPPAKADMIVVIGGDWRGNRILKAAELVRQGYAPTVLVSGSGSMYGFFESDLAVNFAVAKGYPRETFVASQYPALNTLDEAQSDIRELRARGIRRYILVTSDYHTARAGRIFRREGRDLDVRVISAPDPYWANGEWWKDREGQKLWFNEFIKTIANFLGI